MLIWQRCLLVDRIVSSWREKLRSCYANTTQLLDLVLGTRWHDDDPQHYLVDLLSKIQRIYAERSGGMHSSILDTINHFVRLEDGSPVRGLSVMLSPVEREIYGAEEMNLAELPDRREFLAALESLRADIIRELDVPGER